MKNGKEMAIVYLTNKLKQFKVKNYVNNLRRHL